MAKWVIQGDDASPIPPDPNDYIPGAMPKFNPPKGANGDDSGALWWDHDDAGATGNQGYGGLPGGTGTDGRNGGNTPQGVRLVIPSDTTGIVTLVLAGGDGQPGGRGGIGGMGGEGQDGGDGDDEQPPGAGGKGGNGGPGGVGGRGGNGGTAFSVDVILEGSSYSSIVQQTSQGSAGPNARGGPGGPPGPGGRGGNGGAFAPAGDPAPEGPGPAGPGPKDGALGKFNLL